MQSRSKKWDETRWDIWSKIKSRGVNWKLARLRLTNKDLNKISDCHVLWHIIDEVENKITWKVKKDNITQRKQIWSFTQATLMIINHCFIREPDNNPTISVIKSEKFTRKKSSYLRETRAIRRNQYQSQTKKSEHITSNQMGSLS